MKSLYSGFGWGLFLTLFSLSCWAQGNQHNKQTKKPHAEEEKSSSRFRITRDLTLPTVNEDWYFYFDAGLIFDTYGGDIGQTTEDIEKNDSGSDGTTPGGFATSVGFYFPFNNHKTMMGPILSLGYSTWEIENSHDQEFEMYTKRYDASFSMQHFFGRNIGHGFFLRGDAGVSYYEFATERTSLCLFDCEERASIRFRDGKRWYFENIGDRKTIKAYSANFLLGLGGAWPVGRGQRMQAMLSHTLRPSVEGNLGTTYFSMGMIF